MKNLQKEVLEEIQQKILDNFLEQITAFFFKFQQVFFIPGVPSRTHPRLARFRKSSNGFLQDFLLGSLQDLLMQIYQYVVYSGNFILELLLEILSESHMELPEEFQEHFLYEAQKVVHNEFKLLQLLKQSPQKREEFKRRHLVQFQMELPRKSQKELLKKFQGSVILLAIQTKASHRISKNNQVELYEIINKNPRNILVKIPENIPWGNLEVVLEKFKENSQKNPMRFAKTIPTRKKSQSNP